MHDYIKMALLLLDAGTQEHVTLRSKRFFHIHNAGLFHTVLTNENL